MCDEDTAAESEIYLQNLSRRQFNGLAAGIAVAGMTGAAVLPVTAAAETVMGSDVEIVTPDGTADAYFVYPKQGKHPAVLIWPDIMGLRSAFRGMATRLAASGYAVLVVNPFYRSARAPIAPEGASFQDPETRAKVLPHARRLSASTHFTDATAFMAFLDLQEAVDTQRKAATMGYCMGGPMVMRTAATKPDRIGVGASFHGGGLVTAKSDSPHLLIPDMKAEFLIAVADNDDQREPETKNILEQAFTASGIKSEIEVYEGAMHGWCPPDSRVYNHPQAEKAWERLLVTLERAL
jgi:carboxymethylenebutenolidase